MFLRKGFVCPGQAAMASSLRQGVRQGELRRFSCVWGEHAQRHSAMVPFFKVDYKVFGLMGFSLGSPPVWYPGTPVHVSGRTLRFKDSYAELPPPLPTLEPDTFVDSYYFDPWRVLSAVFAAEPRMPDFSSAVNLADYLMRKRYIMDVLLEAPLHRVRGFMLKGSWFRTYRVSTLKLPSLAEAIVPMEEPRGPAPGTPQNLGEFLMRLFGRNKPLAPLDGGAPKPPGR